MKIGKRKKYIQLYSSRLPFIEMLGLESHLDFDRGGVMLRDLDGRESLIPFVQMLEDIDGYISKFAFAAGGVTDMYDVEIRVTLGGDVVYFARDRVREFTTEHRPGFRCMTWSKGEES